jgi:hypothetical protein
MAINWRREADTIINTNVLFEDTASIIEDISFDSFQDDNSTDDTIKGTGINSNGEIVFESIDTSNKPNGDGKLYYLYDYNLGTTTPERILTKVKYKENGAMVERLKTTRIEDPQIKYAEIAKGWGQWTKHPDSILFFNAVFQFVGCGAYTDIIGKIVYQNEDALAAINLQDGKVKIIKDDNNPIKRISIKYLSKATLEISPYKGLFNIYILRSILQHEGRHLEQISTRSVARIGGGSPISVPIILGGETWWASVEDECYKLSGHMEADAYNIQMDAKNEIWQAILIRATKEYSQTYAEGKLFIKFKDDIENGKLNEFYKFKRAEKIMLGE